MNNADNVTTQQNDLINLLWDSLKRSPGHHDRRMTAWGSKTKLGLVACIERIYTPDKAQS